jgi:hypothetical protein
VVIRGVVSCHECGGILDASQTLMTYMTLIQMGGRVTSPPNSFFYVINTLVQPFIMALNTLFFNCIIGLGNMFKREFLIDSNGAH